MNVFQDPLTGLYVREDGKPGFACARCGNGYATTAAREVHPCEGLNFDVESFEGAKGLFEQGYTAEDIDAIATDIATAQFLCAWAYLDDDGYGGDSEIIGREILPDGTRGPWKPLDDTFARFLYDSAHPVTLADVHALLGEQDYATQDFEEFPTLREPNVAHDNRVA